MAEVKPLEIRSEDNLSLVELTKYNIRYYERQTVDHSFVPYPLEDNVAKALKVVSDTRKNSEIKRKLEVRKYAVLVALSLLVPDRVDDWAYLQKALRRIIG